MRKRPFSSASISKDPTTFINDDYVIRISVTDPLGVVRSLTYDASSNVLSATDPLGFKVTRVFDSRGNIVSMTDPLGNTSKILKRLHQIPQARPADHSAFRYIQNVALPSPSPRGGSFR